MFPPCSYRFVPSCVNLCRSLSLSLCLPPSFPLAAGFYCTALLWKLSYTDCVPVSCFFVRVFLLRVYVSLLECTRPLGRVCICSRISFVFLCDKITGVLLKRQHVLRLHGRPVLLGSLPGVGNGCRRGLHERFGEHAGETRATVELPPFG